MARNRQETLSSLGRAPARTSRASLPPPPPQLPDPPERGAVARWIHGALFDNVGLKFLSVVLAITVFLLVNTDKDEEITAKVGVSYTLPDDKALVSDRVDELRVTIKGSRRRLKRFDDHDVDRVNLDLRRTQGGDVLITPDMIHLPSGLSVTSISPRTVHVAFDRRIEKLVLVEAKTDGQPQHGFAMASAKVTPAAIQVRGAESSLQSLSAIPTAMISIEGRTEGFVADTTVVPPEGVDVIGSPRVAVSVLVEELLVRSALVGQPVIVRGDGVDPARYKVTPAQVNITLTGSLLAVEKAKAVIAPYVKLPPGGAGDADILIDNLPPGIGATISPERVKVAPPKP